SEGMSADTCWCYEDEAVEQAAGHMRERQVRRMPGLDRRKNLAGMLSLGDVATHVDHRQAGKALERVSEAARPRAPALHRSITWTMKWRPAASRRHCTAPRPVITAPPPACGRRTSGRWRAASRWTSTAPASAS